jgi:dTDP-4-dehydrorhamnose reductase
VKVLLAGAGGQLGTELRRLAPGGIELQACDRAALDITDAEAVRAAVGSGGAALIINAAAYTAVERAESEPERAHAVNAVGAGNLASAAAAIGARMIHVSTDYVFDGESPMPYAEDAGTNPVNVYGRSKLEGERLVLKETGGSALIVRTSWVYSLHGRNFATVMLERMRTDSGVRVVADQVGTPTWAGSLAEAIWKFACSGDVRGLWHWTDAGVASWYDFSVAIMEEALAAGVLARSCPVVPIATRDYESAARRPPYSVLDKRRAWALLGSVSPHWRASLRRMFRDG